MGLYLQSKPRLALVFIAACLTTIFILDNQTAKLAVLASFLVYVVVRWRAVMFWPVVITPLLIGAAFPAFFAEGVSNSVLCAVQNTQSSAAHRLLIYEFSSQKIFERPFTGWGLDASRTIPGGRDEAREIYDCSQQGLEPKNIKSGSQMPLHPHNASLQVWLELGVVGVLIIIGVLFLLLYRMHRDYADGLGRPMIASVFTIIFLVYNISFGLWQSWLIFGLILVFAIMSALRKDLPNSHSFSLRSNK
jgi:O-antigen ligase